MHIVLACLVASGAVVWVWPPGAHFYLGESVVLRCNVSTPAAVAADTRPPQQGQWSYQWFRHWLHGAPPSLDLRRHLASGDTYTITGATAEDGGSYWCRAEAPGPGVNSSIVLLLSERVQLTVFGILPSLLSLIPNSLQFFRGDNLTVQCPGSVNNLTAWRLRQLSQDFGDGLEVATQSSAHSEAGVGMALENVSKAQEGFYKCASQDRTIESPESWLSVKFNSTWTDWTEDSTHGTGTWIIISSAVVVTVFFLSTVLIVCLVHHRGGKQSTQACCWPSSKAEPVSKEVPKTKQDATEVQWDLSWMELSHLLDKP
ncbi:hypothetical protein CRUP_024202 [Coryphaenoides rupestris]|nr:hypothetical protein CRUP_024202 [Coryphaenoides rupestris]